MTFDTTRGRVDEAEMPAAAEGRAPFRAWLYRLATMRASTFWHVTSAASPRSPCGARSRPTRR